MKSYYDVLHVPQTATLKQIKTAYRTLVKRYHPDVNKDTLAQFKEVQEAYNVLSDANKRQQHDWQLKPTFPDVVHWSRSTVTHNGFSVSMDYGFPGKAEVWVNGIRVR